MRERTRVTGAVAGVTGQETEETSTTGRETDQRHHRGGETDQRHRRGGVIDQRHHRGGETDQRHRRRGESVRDRARARGGGRGPCLRGTEGRDTDNFMLDNQCYNVVNNMICM